MNIENNENREKEIEKMIEDNERMKRALEDVIKAPLVFKAPFSMHRKYADGIEAGLLAAARVAQRILKENENGNESKEEPRVDESKKIIIASN